MAQKVLNNTINTDFIRSLPLLSGLSEIEKDALFKEGGVYFYPRKDTLFRMGDAITRFYIICSGTVRLYHETPDGCEITTDIRIAGDILCATSFSIPQYIHQSHAEIIRDATIMEFPIEWLRQTARHNNAIASSLLSILSQRIHKLKTETENKTRMSAIQRTACFLQQTCVIEELNPSGFDLPYSKSLIASRLDMDLATLSRTLPKLEEVGITIEGKHVSFQDQQKTDQAVCNHCSDVEICYFRKFLRTASPSPLKDSSGLKKS